MQRRRSVARALLSSLAVLGLGAGGAAWACTAQAQITLLPASGPADSQISITGSGFNPGPVQIRWNSQDGRVLGAAEGPRFSTWIRVPKSASSEVYYVVAVQGRYKAAQAFEVRGADAGWRRSATAIQPQGDRGLSNDLWSGLRRRAGLEENPSITQASPARNAMAGALFVAGLAGVVAALGFALAARRRPARGSRDGPGDHSQPLD